MRLDPTLSDTLEVVVGSGYKTAVEVVADPAATTPGATPTPAIRTASRILAAALTARLLDDGDLSATLLTYDAGPGRRAHPQSLVGRRRCRFFDRQRLPALRDVERYRDLVWLIGDVAASCLQL